MLSVEMTIVVISTHSGTQSFLLTKLEQEAQDYITLGGSQFFLKKVWKPVWNIISIYAMIGGCIMMTQWGYWIIYLMKRALSACCKSPLLVASTTLKKGGVCYTKGKKGLADDLELGAPL